MLDMITNSSTFIPIVFILSWIVLMTTLYEIKLSQIYFIYINKKHDDQYVS